MKLSLIITGSFLSVINQLVCSQKTSKIVGGTSSRIEKWPWQGLLIEKPSKAICGCTLIYSRWVITAAHCTEKQAYSSLLVRFGVQDKTIYTEQTREFEFIELYQHENYTVETFQNDVSLLKLAEEVTYTRYTVPIELPAPGSILPVGHQCVITGYGSTYEDSDEASDVIMEANVPIVSDSMCAEWYNQDDIVVFSDIQMCAGYEDGGIDSCQGDSGGPLVCTNEFGGYTLHGVTSFGVGCGRYQRPGVYTRLSSFMQWIEDTIDGSGSIGLNAGLVSLVLPTLILVAFQ